jgi:hypothetical protein
MNVEIVTEAMQFPEKEWDFRCRAAEKGSLASLFASFLFCSIQVCGDSCVLHEHHV